MKWQPVIRRFGIRFSVCLIILGGTYIVIFGIGMRSHNKPATPAQKIAHVRAGLNESYLSGSSLSNFERNDALSSTSLGSTFGQYQAAQNDLRAAIKTAGPLVSPAFRDDLRAVMTREQQASDTFTAIYPVLSHVIAYDPSDDLGGISADKDSNRLAERAIAAQKGLKKAADDQTAAGASSLSVQSGGEPVLLIDTTTKQALTAAADCFGQIATRLHAHLIPEATSTRNNCMAAYPAVRLQAIHTITHAAFPTVYQNFMKDKVPPLLRQLDSLLAANN